MIRRTLSIIALVAVFALGAWLSSLIYRQKAEQESRSHSVVLLEQVTKVCKLVTVEGTFSELYDETNIKKFTFYLPLPSTWSFSKQAILQVRGKVLVGYDMENVRIRADSTQRLLIISNLPEPQILAVDHLVEYKNLDESFFNSFTPGDYTRLNKNAKDVLSRKAEESGLMKEAQAQGNQMLEVIRFMAASVGWTVVVERGGVQLPLDTLLKG
jgi:hypothetical protein